MNRAGVLSIVLAAAITGACGGAEDVGSSPTGPSSTSTTTTAPTPPPTSSTVCVAAPTNLFVESIKGTVVTLRWTGVSNANDYLVLVGSSPSSSDQLSTNTSQTYHTWTAKQGRQYARVQAKAACGYSSSSNEVEYTVG